jgi:8-oxo-dGTP pyrophosphatase MutT (NUDIX family)
MPITSIGIIAFRYVNDEIQYLMIRRKDTLGYIDFMRGKYSLYNKDYIMNMIKQMTNDEKLTLKAGDFDSAWKRIWGNETISNQYKSEESISREKFNALVGGILFKNELFTLSSLIDESYSYENWDEAEWGFPKGRRNYQEKDYDCALREFSEETGYSINHLNNIQNLLPFEEIFTGSNYKSYKHKYYLTFMKAENTQNTNNFEPTEVSKMEWKSYNECMQCIRNYNLEKQRMLKNINHILKNYRVFSY